MSNLITVFNDTLTLVKSKYPYLEKEEVIDKKQILSIKANLNKIYPKFKITKNDCLVDAFNEIKTGAKVAVINSASLKNPGGGVLNGSRAQEESLCRRSNLYSSLIKQSYPLHQKVKGIYHPNVTIFKDEKYLLTSPYQVNIISLFSRPLNNLKTDAEIYHLYQDIFSSMFYLCNQHQIDTLVFVPIGCGVFKHPPEWVADYLFNYLEEKALSVKKVIISCFDNDYNYNTFKLYFTN